MVDPIQALAKVMYVADWHAQRPEYTLERVGSWWEKETQLCRDQYGVVAEAALRFLAFVDSAGEVYCPSEGAVARLTEALRLANEDGERLAAGLTSCRDYLAALARSGMVAGHEMQIPSYEVTDALAAHEAREKETV